MNFLRKEIKLIVLFNIFNLIYIVKFNILVLLLDNDYFEQDSEFEDEDDYDFDEDGFMEGDE